MLYYFTDLSFKVVFESFCQDLDYSCIVKIDFCGTLFLSRFLGCVGLDIFMKNVIP